jgi:hypothetical protein
MLVFIGIFVGMPIILAYGTAGDATRTKTSTLAELEEILYGLGQAGRAGAADILFWLLKLKGQV